MKGGVDITAGALPSEYVGPGLFDLQLNGYAGFDFNGDPGAWNSAALDAVRLTLARRGVMAALPTFITDAPEALSARAQRFAELTAPRAELAEAFPKIHLEGPFISPSAGPRGAHPLAHCRTPRELPDLVPRLHEASGGRVGIVTLAPELAGAEALIRTCVALGIRVALGHTEASPAQMADAIAAGATMSTHLGNGSHATLPRLDNYVQRQLAADALWGCFIADGHHVPFPTLQNFLRAKTFPRSILVTDAISAAELGSGTFPLGPLAVRVDADGRTSLPGCAGLAGSVLTLDRAVLAVARHCGVPFAQAWRMASEQPTAALGLAPRGPVRVEIGGDGFRQVTP